MDYCLLSSGEWVLRVFLVPRVAHSLSHTSPLCLPLSLRLCYSLFCLLLFCVSLCISLLLTFSHTKQRDFFFFFFWKDGVIFLCMGCFVLFGEQVGRLVVTEEERWVELFQPVWWLSLPKDWMQRPPHKSPATQTGREENSHQTMQLIRAETIIHMHHHLPRISDYLSYLGKICYCSTKVSIKRRGGRVGDFFF